MIRHVSRARAAFFVACLVTGAVLASPLAPGVLS